VPHIERILEGMDVLGNICREYPDVFPMLRRVLRPEHFAREVVDRGVQQAGFEVVSFESIFGTA
jgi:hypothetical protein